MDLHFLLDVRLYYSILPPIILVRYAQCQYLSLEVNLFGRGKNVFPFSYGTCGQGGHEEREGELFGSDVV